MEKALTEVKVLALRLAKISGQIDRRFAGSCAAIFC
jgi:hypothetical protein